MNKSCPLNWEYYTYSKLIEKIKNDSEWNIINYFDEIDDAFKSNCSPNEKIDLILLKTQYLASVNRIEEAQILIKKAEKTLSKSNFKDSLRALIQLRKSGYYAIENDFFNCYKEWNKCNNYYLLTKNFNGLANCQLVLVSVYLTLKQNDFAFQACKKAKQYAQIKNNKHIMSDVYSSYASYWAYKNNIDSALFYLRISENYEPVLKNDLTKNLNKGILYYSKGELDDARLYFNKVIKNAKRLNCKGYEGQGKYGLALTYMNEDYVKSFDLMKEALFLIDNYNPDLGINICECILDNYDNKEYEALLPFFKKRKKQLIDKKEYDGFIQVGKLFNLSSSMNNELMDVQKQLDKELLEASKQNRNFVILAFIVIFILFSLLYFLYLFFLKLKSKKLLEEQVEQQRKLLNNSVVTITNYNAVSESLSQKLKQMALEMPNKKTSDKLYELSRGISEFTLGAKSKELKDLDLVIQSINDGFVKKICQKYPNLTSNEITLAIYLRMNFSTKQIAEMKGASENSVDVARSRLRSKIGLKGESIDLVTYLNNF